MTKYIGPKTADENVATQADKLSLSSATPDALTPDQAGAAGTATTAARSDHQHEILAGAAGTILPDDAAAEGGSTSFARADHTHAITAAAPSANLTASTTNSEGTATSFARSDHSHAITTAAPGTISPDDAAAAGTSASLARADHTHAITAASAGTISYAAAEGTATSFARSDHNHQIQAVGAFYAYRGSVQSVNGSTSTTIQFDTELFDISGWFDSTTNKGRYTPQKAGYYLISTMVMMASGAGFYGVNVFRSTTGTENDYATLAGSSAQRNGGSTIVYLDGVDDYVVIRMFHTNGTALNTDSGQTNVWVAGHYLGSA